MDFVPALVFPHLAHVLENDIRGTLSQSVGDFFADEFHLLGVSFREFRVCNPNLLNRNRVVKFQSAGGAVLRESRLLLSALLSLIACNCHFRRWRVLGMLKHLFPQPQLVLRSQLFEQSPLRSWAEDLALEPADESVFVFQL